MRYRWVRAEIACILIDIFKCHHSCPRVFHIGEYGKRGCPSFVIQCLPKRVSSMSRLCRYGCSNDREHGGRPPRLQDIWNRTRRPVLRLPPTAPGRVQNNAPERRSLPSREERRTAPRECSRPASVLGVERLGGTPRTGAWGHIWRLGLAAVLRKNREGLQVEPSGMPVRTNGIARFREFSENAVTSEGPEVVSLAVHRVDSDSESRSFCTKDLLDLVPVAGDGSEIGGQADG